MDEIILLVAFLLGWEVFVLVVTFSWLVGFLLVFFLPCVMAENKSEAKSVTITDVIPVMSKNHKTQT